MIYVTALTFFFDLCLFLLLFFFSSRRRHTRFDCDWSSDVCSSDLALCITIYGLIPLAVVSVMGRVQTRWPGARAAAYIAFGALPASILCFPAVVFKDRKSVV